MDVAKIDPKDPSRRLVTEAVAVLRRGGLVVAPTETAYGLLCDATSSEAVRRIFAVKGRDPGKPLPLIAASLSMASRYVRFDAVSRRSARAFWPGPLTIVAPSAFAFPDGVANAGGEAAVRVTSSPTALALAKGLGRPVVATSANASGGETPYDALLVLRQLGTLPDMVLDAGRLPKRKTSTVVRYRGGECEILRAGAVATNALLEVMRSC